jgi:hypothetical protein
MSQFSRREFLGAAAVGASLLATFGQPRVGVAQEEKKGADIQFGLVTYQWGKDWDLPTLITNCARSY